MRQFCQHLVILLAFSALLLNSAAGPVESLSNILVNGKAKALDNKESLEGQQPLTSDLKAQPPPSLLGPGEDITIHVRKLTGELKILQVNTLDTILSVKEKIEPLFDIPVEKQRLIYAGKQLEDGRTLADYNIKDGTVIHLVVRLD